MLLDVDRVSVDRSDPQPNARDVIAHDAVMAKSTNSTNYITPASNQAVLTGAKNGQFNLVSSGTFSVNVSYTTTDPGGGYSHDSFVVEQFAHGFNFIPGLMVYYEEANDLHYPLPFSDTTMFFNPAWYTFWATIDSHNVTVYLDTISGGTPFGFAGNFNFRYYLSQQTSN